jgi:hypothetical protein
MITGPVFLAALARGDTLAGVRLGDAPHGTSVPPGLEYVDDEDRRQSALRRDFGALELTFVGSPTDRICTNATLQLHRFATTPWLREEFLRFFDVDFAARTPWSVVLQEMHPDLQLESHRVSGYDLVQIAHRWEYAVVAEAPADACLAPGDVWSVRLGRDLAPRSGPATGLLQDRQDG